MTTAVTARAGRNADLIAVVSGVLHAGVVAFGFFLADQSGSRNYLLLSAFAMLGLVATLLGWASVKAGSRAWGAGVAVVVASLGVLAWAVAGEGGLGILAIAGSMLFLDWLLFDNARRALT